MLIQPTWSGFIRAHKKCTGNGKRRPACRTGNCKTSNLYCKDLPPLSPVTLVVFLKGFGHDQDRYALNLALSFNTPVSVKPVGTLQCGMGACMWMLSVHQKLRVLGKRGEVTQLIAREGTMTDQTGVSPSTTVGFWRMHFLQLWVYVWCKLQCSTAATRCFLIWLHFVPQADDVHILFLER